MTINNNQPMLATEPCPSCGAAGFHTQYSGPEGKRMNQTGECFMCAFWEIRAEHGEKVVIDNYVYSIGAEPADMSSVNRSWLGMSGRRFDIEFISGGRRITTHNLWCGGEIPEKWRSRLPNTARFVSGAERAQVGETTCWNPASENVPEYPKYEDMK